ncbi:hypothetical protein E2320_010882, partial [Naja naja]
MGETQRLQSYKNKIFQCLITIFIWKAISGNIHYVVREETLKGFFVGNIPMDLGIDGNNLSEYGLWIATRTGMNRQRKKYGWAENCVLSFEVITESKIETYGVEVKITDIDDNVTQFTSGKHEIKIIQGPDLGINSIQRYEITGNSHFSLDMQIKANGTRQDELVLKKNLDREWFQNVYFKFNIWYNNYYEESSLHEFEVKAKDGEFIKGEVIALLNVQDDDSGVNRKVTCSVPNNLTFQFFLKQSISNFYRLVTMILIGNLDYKISITATDHGSAPLTTVTEIFVQILDTNDNSPQFLESKYTSYLLENNPKGASAFSLKASDPDWEENARIIYSITDSLMWDSPLSSYLSDGGSPSLNSNVSVALFILDQNDNVPEILYSSPPADGSTGIELAPRSSEPGYLVIKVVAVDADSGQNSWLSYQLIRATEPGLFTMGLHTGEIRTVWLFLEENALKQILVVLVKDNVHPAPFALTTLMVVLADHIPNILTELSNILFSGDSQSDLTFYSVIAVDLDSCLFFTFLFIFFHYTFQNLRKISSFPIGICTNVLKLQQASIEPNSSLIQGDSILTKEETTNYQ